MALVGARRSPVAPGWPQGVGGGRGEAGQFASGELAGSGQAGGRSGRERGSGSGARKGGRDWPVGDDVLWRVGSQGRGASVGGGGINRGGLAAGPGSWV